MWSSDNTLKYLACHQPCWCMSSYRQKVRLEILSTHVHVLPALYICCLFSWRDYPPLLRAEELKFKSRLLPEPLHCQTIYSKQMLGLGRGCDTAAVPTGASGKNAASLFWFRLHASSKGACVCSRFALSVGFWLFFRHTETPSQITGSILCFHSEPCEPPQSAITAPPQSRSFIIFAAQTAQCSF